MLPQFIINPYSGGGLSSTGAGNTANQVPVDNRMWLVSHAATSDISDRLWLNCHAVGLCIRNNTL
jgi:hypothetical protein